MWERETTEEHKFCTCQFNNTDHKQPQYCYMYRTGTSLVYKTDKQLCIYSKRIISFLVERHRKTEEVGSTGTYAVSVVATQSGYGCACVCATYLAPTLPAPVQSPMLASAE